MTSIHRITTENSEQKKLFRLKDVNTKPKFYQFFKIRPTYLLIKVLYKIIITFTELNFHKALNEFCIYLIISNWQ